MAYAFNRLNQALDKANIFEDKDNDSTAEGQGLGQPERADQPEVTPLTTSTAGPSVQSSSARRPMGSSRVDQGVGTTANQLAIREAQKGGIQVPGVFGKLTQSLDKQRSDLQASADTYLNNQREAARRAGEVTDEQIGAAAEGNPDAYNRVNRSATSIDVRNPDVFNIPSPEELARSTAEARSVLGGEASMARALARGKGPDYTPEMSRFDVAAIKGAPGFSRTLSSLGENYTKLSELSNKLRNEYPEKARTEAETIAKGQRNSTRNRIDSYLGELDRRNQADSDLKNAEELRAFEQYKASLGQRTDPGLLADIEALKQKALQELKDTYGGSEEELNDLSGENLLNYMSPSDLRLTPHRLHEYTRGQMYDPVESRKFENLAKILGNGQVRTAGDYQRPISKYSGSEGQYQLERDRLKNGALYTVKQRNSLAPARQLGEMIHTGRGSDQEKQRLRSTLTDGLRAFGSDAGRIFENEILSKYPQSKIQEAMRRIGFEQGYNKSFDKLIPLLIEHFDPSFGRLKNYAPEDNRWAAGAVADSDRNAEVLNKLANSVGNVADYGTMTSENLFRRQNESVDTSKQRIRDYSKSLVETLVNELKRNGGL